MPALVSLRRAGSAAPPGYFGCYLRVDLAAERAERVPLAPETLRAFLGGVGLGTALLHRESEAGHDPLSAAARLVFAFSPLVGSPLTTSAKLAIVAKSPLTERLCDALSSSTFALSGKRLGADALVLCGRARTPSVLLCDETGARVEPCPELWGDGAPIDLVDERLRERYPGYAFAVTGVAGERGVRFACIANDRRHAGRGGLGAVLGAMRLKAVGVRGRRAVPLHDAGRVVALARDLAARSLGPATEKYRALGTVANLAAFNRLAALPTRNFQASTFEGAARLSGEELARTRARGRSSCRACTIGCEHFFAETGEARPVKLEYESLFALGPLCGISDPDLVLRAARRCDALGLDTISAGASVAFAMECAERGLFRGTPWQEQARPLAFGDGDALLGALDDIAHRHGALGDLLAEGTRRAAARIGGPAPDFAPHVKGLEIPGYEPRALQTMALGFAVSSRGADHNRSGAYEVDFSTEIDRLAPSLEAARLAADTEDRAALVDSLILCKFLRGVFDDIFAESADMLAAVTGWPVCAAELRATAARIVLAKKLFNVREGWTRAEDTLPQRFLGEALPNGAAAGAVVDPARLEALVGAYYAARGWRPDGGVPPERIREAELDRLLHP